MSGTASTGGAARALQLLALLPASPIEFADRVRAILEVRSEKLSPRARYRCTPYQDMLTAIQDTLSCGLDESLRDPALYQIEAQVTTSANELSARSAPFSSAHNADLHLARLAWAIVFALKPPTVLETGVAYGVTSSYVLAALESIGRGVLHSIDLPPLGHNGDRYVGALVPSTLRHRWRLHRGTSRRLLPRVLQETSSIGLFIHDSLHTRGNILAELRAVRPFLAERSVVIADDIEANTAFEEWVAESAPAYHAVVREATKDSLMGVAVFDIAQSR